MLVEGETVVEI